MSGHAAVFIVVATEGSQGEDGAGHLGRELGQAAELVLVHTDLGSLTACQEGNEGEKVVVDLLLELPCRMRDGVCSVGGVLTPVYLSLREGNIKTWPGFSHLAGPHLTRLDVEVGHQEGPG